MPMRTSFENRVITPLPADISPEAIIELLHDHSYLIQTQPLVYRFAPREGVDNSPSAGKAIGGTTYDVWEKIAVLPGKLWTHDVHFTTSFRETRNGVASHVDAPMGFVSDATYMVRPREMGDAENGKLEGEWTLEEHIVTECNFLFKPLILANMLHARKKIHHGLISRAREQPPVSSNAPSNPGLPEMP